MANGLPLRKARNNRISNSVSVSIYFSAVNQKLLYARQLLAIARDAQGQKHLATALVQSIVLHQWLAWRWHLQDVAATYKLSDIERVDSADRLKKLLLEQGKTPAEATELFDLESDTDSWVSELQSAYRELFKLPATQRAEMDINRLPVVVVDNNNVPIDWNLNQIGGWQQRLQELIERQREMMVEF